MTHRISIGLLVVLLVALGMVASGGFSPANAAVPPPPPTCSAVQATGGYQVSWTRPATSDSPIWRYVIKVKGQSTPVEQTQPKNLGEDPTRSWLWSGPTAGTNPLTFQVRAVNSSGYGDWCETPVGGDPPPPPDDEQNPFMERGGTSCGLVDVNFGVGSEDTLSSDFEIRVDGSSVYEQQLDPGDSPGNYFDTLPEDFSGGSANVVGLANGSQVLAFSVNTNCATTPPADLRPLIPYGESSYLQEELTGQSPNATRTAGMRNAIANHPDQQGKVFPVIRGVGGNAWGVAHRRGNCSDPVWRFSGGNIPSQWAHLRTSGFHAPADLGQYITGTSDSPLVVKDFCNGFTLWAAKTAYSGSGTTITFDSGGVVGAFVHTSNGLDRRNPLSNSAVNERSRGVIPDSMVIDRALFEWALRNDSADGLGHVMEIFWVETDTDAGHVHPMVGHESGKNWWGAEGQRIGISQSVNLDAKCTSEASLILARTWQVYGLYLGDNSGSESAVKAEQGMPGLTPNTIAACNLTINDWVAY